MQLDEFFDYKNQLMEDVLTNENVVKLLTDKEMTPDPTALAYVQVFPYEYIPTTVEHGQTFICFDVDIQRSTVKTFYEPTLYVWVFSHISKLRIPNGDGTSVLTGGGVRTDKLCSEIAHQLDGSRFYGLGELELYAARRFAPVSDYQGKQLTFKTRDVKRTTPTGKPIPSNRKRGE